MNITFGLVEFGTGVGGCIYGMHLRGLGWKGWLWILGLDMAYGMDAWTGFWTASMADCTVVIVYMI
jgi:hypothetical protein